MLWYFPGEMVIERMEPIIANNMIKWVCLELCIPQVMVIFIIRDKSKSLAHFPVMFVYHNVNYEIRSGWCNHV